MLTRHYAPSTKLLLTDEVKSCLAQYPAKKIGLLLFKEEIDHPQVKHQIILSKSGDMKEAAANLYQALHQLDNIDIELIIAEKFPMNGLGNTINDRLARATKNK
jgi:L-threonylcarbamoyladenylate synthase